MRAKQAVPTILYHLLLLGEAADLNNMILDNALLTIHCRAVPLSVFVKANILLYWGGLHTSVLQGS